jgi:RNA polymerase-binding transcription factor DksA
MNDIADNAEKQEAMARELMLKRHRERPKETPEFDEYGSRICLDCGGDIGEKRIKAVDAVRCIHCQNQLEKENKLWK